MAICFVRAKVIGRSSGHSAVAAAAYRSSSKIKDEQTGIVHDYTKKQGVEYSEILSPIAVAGVNEWLIDRAALWNQVEATEKRCDAQLSREMIIAIPRELDRDAMVELVREHVRSSYVDRGMVADINLHNLGGNNPHAHVMLTMRELKIDEQGVVSFGNKDRSWNEKKLVETQKKEWEKLANQYLERAGVETRIDARSYEEQGIPRIPQVHVGVAAWRLEKQGIITTPGDRNREVAALNRALENYQAEIAITQLNIETELRLEIERRAAETAAQMERDQVADEEYTALDPEPEVKDEALEADDRLARLILDKIDSFVPVTAHDKGRKGVYIAEQTIGRKSGEKLIEICYGTGVKIAEFKLNGDSWTKVKCYPKYTRYPSQYPNERIDELVDDLPRSINEYIHKSPALSTEDLKYCQLAKSIENLLQKWGHSTYYPVDEDLIFYRNSNAGISIYNLDDRKQVCRITNKDSEFQSVRKLGCPKYNIERLTEIVNRQHQKFDSGESMSIELNFNETRALVSFSDWKGLEVPNSPQLMNLRERAKPIIETAQARRIYDWLKKTPYLELAPDEITKAFVSPSRPVEISVNDPFSSVYTTYQLRDLRQNAILEIRANRGCLEMVSGKITPLITEQLAAIEQLIAESNTPDLEVERRAAEAKKVAENQATLQSIVDLVQNRLATHQVDVTSPEIVKNALVTQVDDSDKYFPPRLEIVNWLNNRDCAHRDEIYQLGMQLRAEFMKQDSTIGQPAPDRLPDDYWSDKVWISISDKDKYDEVERIQRHEAAKRVELLAAEAAKEQARVEMVERLIREGNERDKAAAAARIQRERGWEQEFEAPPVDNQQEIDDQKYFPTKAELVNWWQTAEIRSEVDLLGESLKIEYQRLNPVSATVPDIYKSDRVWISPADRERFDQATEPRQLSAAELIAQQREKMRDRVDLNPDRGQSRDRGGR